MLPTHASAQSPFANSHLGQDWQLVPSTDSKIITHLSGNDFGGLCEKNKEIILLVLDLPSETRPALQGPASLTLTLSHSLSPSLHSCLWNRAFLPPNAVSVCLDLSSPRYLHGLLPHLLDREEIRPAGGAGRWSHVLFQCHSNDQGWFRLILGNAI